MFDCTMKRVSIALYIYVAPSVIGMAGSMYPYLDRVSKEPAMTVAAEADCAMTGVLRCFWMDG